MTKRFTALTLRTKLLVLLGILGVASYAYAQGPGYNRTPSSTVAAIATNCGNVVGNTCLVTDGLTASDCTSGGGTEDVMCLRTAAGTWVVVVDDAGAAALPGTTSDTFGLDTDGDNLTLSPDVGGLTLDRAAAGTVTLSSTDDDATAALTIDPGGNAALTLGSASDTIVIPVTAGIAFSNSESIANGTNGTLTLGRNDSGTVTVTAADDDATAALTVLPGGAAAFVLGGSSTTSTTLTTDSTGNAELVVPDSSLSSDELGPVLVKEAIFCGDLPNNTTNWASPVSGYPSGILYSATLTATDLSYALAGTGCAAEDDTTEATADEVMFTQTAIKVHGLYCRVSGSGSNGVVFTVRSAAAGLTPAVTCTIATSNTECSSQVQTTTDIAANATVAVQAVSTEDLSAQDYWCTVTFSLQ